MVLFFFFFKQKTAYEIGVRLVGSEMCIRDRLKTKAQSELSDKFNLKNFHQYILDMGPVQFDILFNNLDAWIKKEK